MIGTGKIVVYGLGDAYDLYILAHRAEITVKFAHRVHGIIPAYIEKCLYIVLFKCSHYLHVFGFRHTVCGVIFCQFIAA